MKLYRFYVLPQWQLYFDFVLTFLKEVLFIVKHQEMFPSLLKIHERQEYHK